MNKELIAVSPGAAASSPWRSPRPSRDKLGYIDGDTVTRVVIGMIGLMIACYGNRMPKAVVPSACGPPGHAGGGLVHGAERAGLCRTVGVRPDPGGSDGRVRRGRGGIAVTVGYCLWLRAKAKAA